MISRKTSIVIAETYQIVFSTYHSGGSKSSSYTSVDYEELYDFLYEHNFPAWFCNRARKANNYVVSIDRKRILKEFIMKIQTGEFIIDSTQNWTNEQRETYGQQYLFDLAENILNSLDDLQSKKRFANYSEHKVRLQRALELDGYIFRQSKLLLPENDILNAEEETGLLHRLYKSLYLQDEKIAFRHLDLSEEHYKAGRWEDAIGNARKFLEKVLSEVANKHSLQTSQLVLKPEVYDRPSEIRSYLSKVNLLESKEVETLKALYSLLSHTGGHAYMAQNDQARLLRHLAFTFSQFVMLRLEGFLKSP